MLYAPPPPILISVVILLKLRAVAAVKEIARMMITMVPKTPALPTIVPNRKKRITPIILRKVGTNTPSKAPKSFGFDSLTIFYYLNQFSSLKNYLIQEEVKDEKMDQLKTLELTIPCYVITIGIVLYILFL